MLVLLNFPTTSLSRQASPNELDYFATGDEKRAG